MEGLDAGLGTQCANVVLTLMRSVCLTCRRSLAAKHWAAMPPCADVLPRAWEQRWLGASAATRAPNNAGLPTADAIGQAKELTLTSLGSNVRHERRRKGRKAAFGTSARWRG